MLRDEMELYTKLSGNDGEHTPIGIIGGFLDGYDKGKEDATKWIPCSERLPFAEYGESKSVLSCLENGTMKLLYFNGGNWCYPTGEPYIGVNHKNGWHNRVVAWANTPEPPKMTKEQREIKRLEALVKEKRKEIEKLNEDMIALIKIAKKYQGILTHAGYKQGEFVGEFRAKTRHDWQSGTFYEKEINKNLIPILDKDDKQ